jgi:hypothetical protein
MVTFRNGQSIEDQSDPNARQLIGMKSVRERGSISTPEYCAATGATDRMGLRDLQDLAARDSYNDRDSVNFLGFRLLFR